MQLVLLQPSPPAEVYSVGRPMDMRTMQTRRAFTLLELMICLVIISLLIGILMPLFVLARDGARITVCASNLKNIGLAWQQYLNENKVFPTRNALPDWHYGGRQLCRE